VYLYSESTDIHGCINGNGSKAGTPEFERLGLLEKLSVQNVAADFQLEDTALGEQNKREVDL